MTAPRPSGCGAVPFGVFFDYPSGVTKKYAGLEEALEHGTVGALTGTVLGGLLSPNSPHAALTGMVLGAAIGGYRGAKTETPSPHIPPPEETAQERARAQQTELLRDLVERIKNPHPERRIGSSPYDRFIFDSPYMHAKFGELSPVSRAALLSGVGGAGGAVLLQRLLQPESEWKSAILPGLGGAAGGAALGGLSAAHGQQAGQTQGEGSMLDALLASIRSRKP